MNGGFSEDREDDPISRTSRFIEYCVKRECRRRIPFPRAQEERKRRGDPVLPLKSDTKDHADSLGKLTHWARALVADRYLLPEDAERILGQPIFLEEKRWFEGCLKGWRLKSCRCLMGTKEKRLVMNYLGPFTFLFLRFAGRIL